MKKVLLAIAVATAFVACNDNNGTDSAAKKDTSATSTPVDTAKKMDVPADTAKKMDVPADTAKKMDAPKVADTAKKAK
jgi:hypothetical protein